jgi:mono/diheme cytochrome c family protein
MLARAALLMMLLSPSVLADERLFEKRIGPILEQNCLLCHGGARTRNGLDLRTREGLLKGGDSGPAIVPGQPDKSLLIQAVRYQGKFPMPPKAPLTDAEVADLVRWVKEGARWPRGKVLQAHQ